MKTSLLFSLALAVALTGCNKSTRSNSASETSASSDYTAATTSTNPAAGNATISSSTTADRMSSDIRSAANSASTAIGNAASSVATSARMAEWKLNANDIQADLDSNKEIVRSKSSDAGAPTGSADKKVVESMVKARLEADSDIAPLKIKVDADRHGDVKLTGKAHSAEEVGKAIALALDTEGVTKVTSKIKLDKEAKSIR